MENNEKILTLFNDFLSTKINRSDLILNLMEIQGENTTMYINGISVEGLSRNLMLNKPHALDLIQEVLSKQSVNLEFKAYAVY